MTIRNLKASEIDVRVNTIKENGATLLLYKDARCDMIILDESVGAMNWQRSHTRDNKNCIVSIWGGDKKQWVEKEDTGAESYTEKEKGLASDSFKRACVNWGIGRELYTAPFIWVKNIGGFSEYKGKWKTFEKFSVSHIQIVDGKITELIIIDNNGKIRYTMQSVKNQLDTANKKLDDVLTDNRKLKYIKYMNQFGESYPDNMQLTIDKIILNGTVDNDQFNKLITGYDKYIKDQKYIDFEVFKLQGVK